MPTKWRCDRRHTDRDLTPRRECALMESMETTTHTTAHRYHHSTIGSDAEPGVTIWNAGFDLSYEAPVTAVYRTRAQAVAAVADDIATRKSCWFDDDGNYWNASNPESIEVEEDHDYCDTCHSTPRSTWTLLVDGVVEGRWEVFSQMLR